MEHQHILRFLSVHGLTTILLVGASAGRGVERERNGLYEVPIIVHVIYFCRVGPTYWPSYENQQNTMKGNHNFTILLP